jgi:hypothetical protein
MIRATLRDVTKVKLRTTSSKAIDEKLHKKKKIEQTEQTRVV